jgi:hypothetical protein
MTCFGCFITEKHKVIRLKCCIKNYYHYNLGESVPKEFTSCTTIESLRAFLYIYNIKEYEVLQYEDIR